MSGGESFAVPPTEGGFTLEEGDEILQRLLAQSEQESDDYVSLLVHQAQQLENFFVQARERLAAARADRARRLEETESRFMQERAALIEAQRTEYENALQATANLEQTALETRMAHRAAFHENIENERIEAAERLRVLQAQRDAEAEELERQLQEMRATYQLNADKLSYNLRVLSEKDEENATTIVAQRRKLAKLRELLTAAIQTQRRTEAAFRASNRAIAADLRRTAERQAALQDMHLRTEASARNRFTQVWALREREAVACIKRLLGLDRVITTEILGLDWAPPSVAQEESVSNTPPPLDQTADTDRADAIQRLTDLVPEADIDFTTDSTLDRPPEKTQEPPTRQDMEAELRRYWGELASVLPGERRRTYQTLLNSLQEHLDMLRRRNELLGTTEALEAENAELRELMARVAEASATPIVGAGAQERQ